MSRRIRSDSVAAQLIYAAVFLLLGLLAGYAGLSSAEFCASGRAVCEMPPSRTGLLLLCGAAFVLCSACFDWCRMIGRIYRSAGAGGVDSEDLRWRVVVAAVQTVVSAVLVLAYLLYLGLAY